MRDFVIGYYGPRITIHCGRFSVCFDRWGWSVLTVWGWCRGCTTEDVIAYLSFAGWGATNAKHLAYRILRRFRAKNNWPRGTAQSRVRGCPDFVHNLNGTNPP